MLVVVVELELFGSVGVKGFACWLSVDCLLLLGELLFVLLL